MAKEILKWGKIPKLHGICGLCGTEFTAELEDCDVEVYDNGYSQSFAACTPCPLCHCKVEVFKLKEPDKT